MGTLTFHEEDSQTYNQIKKRVTKHSKKKAALLLVVSLVLFFISSIIFSSNKTEIKNGGPGPSAEELFEYNKMQR